MFPLQCMSVENKGKTTLEEHEIVGACDLWTRSQDSTRLVPEPRQRTEFGWSKISFQVNGINRLDLTGRASWFLLGHSRRHFEYSAGRGLGSTILAPIWLILCYVVMSMLFARHGYNDIRKKTVFRVVVIFMLLFYYVSMFTLQT